MIPLRPNLTRPGAETARLEGHSGPVAALCLLADGRLASGADDNTIRLWDVAAGAETARLEGHSGSGRRPLPARRTGGSPRALGTNTIRLWDVAAGAETARLEGHSGWVTALCLLADGRLASGSFDKTIRLWDVAAGAETACLEGHSDWVTALCLLPDGRLASGSRDKTIRLWDVAAGAETARLEGHSAWSPPFACWRTGGSPRALMTTRSGSGTWRPGPRPPASRVIPTGSPPFACCADGRLASGAYDNRIRLWDVAAGAETARLEGHSGWVAALCLLPDGRLASGAPGQNDPALGRHEEG